MKWFSKLWEKLTRDRIGRVEDEVLGPLVLEESSWQATVTMGGKKVQFSIGGDFEPDKTLIARARNIFQSFEQFDKDVATFLANEAEKSSWSIFADQIRKLTIRDVCLFWPKRPDDGMIFFDGPDECFCWRCDLGENMPTGLGYDS